MTGYISLIFFDTQNTWNTRKKPHVVLNIFWLDKNLCTFVQHFSQTLLLFASQLLYNYYACLFIITSGLSWHIAQIKMKIPRSSVSYIIQTNQSWGYGRENLPDLFQQSREEKRGVAIVTSQCLQGEWIFFHFCLLFCIQREGNIFSVNGTQTIGK